MVTIVSSTVTLLSFRNKGTQNRLLRTSSALLIKISLIKDFFFFSNSQQEG